MVLNAHSWFSFKYGVMKPEVLLEEAARAGMHTVALTDIHSSAGLSDLVRDAKQYGVRPVAGIEFRQGPRLLYIGIAQNNGGLQRLHELLSPHLLDGERLPEEPPELDDVFFILPFTTTARKLRPNERIGIKPSDLTRLPFSPWARRMNELVALLSVTFRNSPGPVPVDFNTHRLLRTVAKTTVLSMLPAEELAAPDECFRTEEEVRRIYRDFPQLIANTERLLEQCSIAFDKSDKTRRSFSDSEATDRARLHRDTLEGLRYRYPNAPAKVMARMHHELDVIESMGFISYFRINQDIVDYARSRGFFHVGRGSGANSLVAYCLRITDVDPMELDLYFERFINTARKKPPDFDIDFSWKDRDEIFKYVFGKYNRPLDSARSSGVNGIHAAQIATYTTFQWRGAIRELGKAMGLPPGEIDALSEASTSFNAGIANGEYRARRRPSDGARAHTDKVARAVLRYGERLLGMPHQFGIHSGGIVITEKPVVHFTALHRPPKGFPVTQISMLECEDMGLHKFDLLSQRGLGHIRDAVEMVNALKGNEECRMMNDEFRMAVQEHSATCRAPSVNAVDHSTFSIQNSEFRRQAVDIHDIPRFKQDPAIKELLRRGDTIGCFYVESPAMRMLLKKLQVDDYLGLVAASSIIRPGVADSGMMREYLLRHHDPERRKLAPKRLLEIMPETYGVMVYQEDVIKVVHLYGGLDLEDSDTVRRGMNIRYRDRPEFKVVEKRFFANCKKRGYPPGEAEEVWRQIQSFASFSFAKGHSASYAVESYQSLYLKAHHPLEFLVAVANNFGGFYHTEFYLHEAKRAGAVIEAPCVNASEELCTLRKAVGHELQAAGLVVVNGDDLPLYHSVVRSTTTKPAAHGPQPGSLIFLGLQNIKSLDTATADRILHERRRNGPFTDLQDLLRRVPLHVEQARILVRVGALRFTGRCKPQLLWDLVLMHRGASDASADGDLFTHRVPEPRLPPLHDDPISDAHDELELLGFPLCDPFLLVELGECGNGEWSVVNGEWGSAAGVPFTNSHSPVTSSPPFILKRDMPSYIGKRVTMLGYLIHVKATDTNYGQRMTFGSFIDPVGDFWDSTQFPQVAARYLFQGRGVYRFTGVVEEEFGHAALRTERFEKLPWKPDPRYGEK